MHSTMQNIPLRVPDILEHARQTYGSTRIVTAGDQYRRHTVTDTARRADQLAAALTRLGIQSGDRVGTLAWNTQEHLEAYFAIPGIGAVLHTLNPRLGDEQLAWILDHAQTGIVIADAELLPLLAGALADNRHVRIIITVGKAVTALPDHITLLDYEQLLAAEDPEFTWPNGDERAAAALCYTSGTTGRPKGVVYSHRSIWLHALLNTSGAQFGLSSDDRILPVVPMFHVLGWGLPYSAFMVGADLLLPGRRTQAPALLDLIHTEAPTMAAGVPTIWNDLLHHIQQNAPTANLSSLRLISSGGARVSESLITWWQSRGVTVYQGCGMTETSSTMTSGLPPTGIDLENVSSYQRTQGRFLIGVQARTVDDSGRPLPRDGRTSGELQLRGPWITGTYFDNDEPAATADGWFRTGDIATITTDGYLTYTDRAKDIIKSGGEWISSVALEDALSGSPDVAEVAVVGVPDDRWQERPLALVVVRPDAEADAVRLKQFLAQRVPRFWIPERWAFTDAIPRTSVGKWDKKVIRIAYENREYSVVRA